MLPQVHLKVLIQLSLPIQYAVEPKNNCWFMSNPWASLYIPEIVKSYLISNGIYTEHELVILFHKKNHLNQLLEEILCNDSESKAKGLDPNHREKFMISVLDYYQSMQSQLQENQSLTFMSHPVQMQNHRHLPEKSDISNKKQSRYTTFDTQNILSVNMVSNYDEVSANSADDDQYNVVSLENIADNPYQSIDRELFQCNGDCGNHIAGFIELCVKDKVKIHVFYHIHNYQITII